MSGLHVGVDAVSVRVLIKLLTLIDARHHEVRVPTLRRTLLFDIQIQQLT